jgi:hypothetical protein
MKKIVGRESQTQQRRRAAAQVVVGSHGKDQSLTAWQQSAVKNWSQHPWNFLTARGPSDEPLYWTKDEKDEVNPIKHFPYQWEFLYHFVDLVHREPMVVVQKARQQYITTVTLGIILWDCLFTDARRWLISKITEDDAIELLRDKIRYPYSRLPLWFRRLYPGSASPANRMDFSRSSSYIRAVAENAAIGDMRGGTASGVLVDEAAFQREYPKIWAAATPMAARIIAVSTPEIGNPGARFMKKQIDERIE